MEKQTFFCDVYCVVKQIPFGKVATYGQIAAMLGKPKMSRQVGWALHVNPDPEHIPCHRVVNRFGQVTSAFAFGGDGVHRALLERENIVFDKNDCINLAVYQWNVTLI